MKQPKLLTHGIGFGKVILELLRRQVRQIQTVLLDHCISLSQINLIIHKLLIIGVEAGVANVVLARKEIGVLLAVLLVLPGGILVKETEGGGFFATDFLAVPLVPTACFFFSMLI